VEENGSAPWRSEQFFSQTVRALQSGNWEESLQWAGVMSHYVGDLSQPLHVTKNFDGADTNQVGIHKWFESTNINSRNASDLTQRVQLAAETLLSSPTYLAQFDASMSVSRIEFNSAARSFAKAEKLLALDQAAPRTNSPSGNAESLFEMAVERLADGAATYALLLDRAWKASGAEDQALPVKPGVPEWEPPVYSIQNSINAVECVSLENR
jgi:hypothetical protein